MMRLKRLKLLVVLTLFTACEDGSGSSALVDASELIPSDSSPTSKVDASVDLKPPQAPPEFSVEFVVDREQVALLGGVASLDFEVPVDTLSITVIVQGDERGWYGIDRWINGDGTPLVEENWPTLRGNEAGCFSCGNFTAQGPGVVTTIAPNRETGQIYPGRHQLELVGWVDGIAATTLSITVIARRGPQVLEEGLLDLNLYFTGAQGWTAEVARRDEYFAACLQRVEALYKEVGIQLGELNYYDLSPELQSVSISDGADSLGALVAQFSPDASPGLNLFFVDEILTGDPDYPDIPGISASVPTPPYLDGTVVSGAVVATRGPLEVPPELRFLDPPAIGQTMAHEIGHALGLFHTSEYDEVSHDHYADTPENDDAYLMHADGTGALISPAQGRTLRANPLIRAHDE